MVPEILNGWLWQARLSIRTAGARAFAAHGYVDPSYRPPRLPFVSVVGPLSLHVEPERENGKTASARVRIPGYVIGQPRAALSTTNGATLLALRFDGRASVQLTVPGLPATAFGDPATGPAVAAAINAALGAAIAANQVTDLDGTPLTDPVLLAALTTLAPGAVRWSAQVQQLVITSTPGTVSTGQRSVIDIMPSTPSANDLAVSLGFAPPFSRSEGRQRLHKLPAPRSMTVEVRIDLWAHSQMDMAFMFDGLASMAPTRGRLTLRPSLLAADAADGAVQLRLLERGEPTTIDSLVHLEGGDGLVDRAKGVVYAASAGAASVPASNGFTLAAGGQITGPVWGSPLVPDPLFAVAPAPVGFAVAVGVQLDAAATAGEAYQLVALTKGATTIASVGLTVVDAVLPSGDPATFAAIVATALLQPPGGPAATATTTWRVPLSQMQTGGTLHARVDGDTGAITLAWDGEAQRLDDPTTTPIPPVLAPGVPMLSADMQLALGGGAGDPLPQPVAVTHLHVFREPYGPIDPRLRTSIASAARLRPGDLISIARSDDGWQIGDQKSVAMVDSIVAGVVQLTKPIAGAFSRGRAIAFQDECFFFQTAVKRRDDLMNRLYHTSVDYRVSALLEDPTARSSATLVLETQESVLPRGAPRASGGHPGVTVGDADPVRGVN